VRCFSCGSHCDDGGGKRCVGHIALGLCRSRLGGLAFGAPTHMPEGGQERRPCHVRVHAKPAQPKTESNSLEFECECWASTFAHNRQFKHMRIKWVVVVGDNLIYLYLLIKEVRFLPKIFVRFRIASTFKTKLQDNATAEVTERFDQSWEESPLQASHGVCGPSRCKGPCMY
jgi:hypothetical protein